MNLSARLKQLFAPRCDRLEDEIKQVVAEADEVIAESEQTITTATAKMERRQSPRRPFTTGPICTCPQRRRASDSA